MGVLVLQRLVIVLIKSRHVEYLYVVMFVYVDSGLTYSSVVRAVAVQMESGHGYERHDKIH